MTNERRQVLTERYKSLTNELLFEEVLRVLTPDWYDNNFTEAGSIERDIALLELNTRLIKIGFLKVPVQGEYEPPIKRK